MNFSFVIGNGVSRTKLSNDFYNDKVTYACNLAYRDFSPTNLITCDRTMFSTAYSELAYEKSKIWTRQRWLKQVAASENTFALPTIPYKPEIKHDLEMNWGSGLYAALLACESDSNVLILIGYDLWSLSKNRINNVYSGENGYGPKEAGGVDPSGWIHQFTKLFQYYPEKQFVFINNENWNIPPQWLEYENFNLDTFSTLNSL